MQVVAFKLRDEEFGVNIFHVQEIHNLVDITRVPFSASFIKGVINQRGSVMPVIDLKKRLGIEQTPYTASTRIVTVIVGDLQRRILYGYENFTESSNDFGVGKKNIKIGYRR